MSTKKTFKIKLDTEFTIDFDGYGFSDAQQSRLTAFKTMIIQEYLDNVGTEEFEVTEKTEISLLKIFEQMFNPNIK